MASSSSSTVPTASASPLQPTSGDPAIEPDEQHDKDSAYGDDTESYTTSLKSSVWNYRFQNGRRYHSFREGAYPLPNDEVEQERLDLIHHLYGLILEGKLHLAPISDHVQRVLDVGTGTGIWAIDFADAHPSAEVIGTDLSPIQPAWVPPNLRFEVDDAESDWTYQSKFDFIHLRTMGGSIADVPRLLQQAYDNLNDGGWIEWQEVDMTVKSDDNTLPTESYLLKYCNYVNLSAEKFGKDMNLGPILKPSMESAGFANVEHKTFKVPLGPWTKDPKLKEQGRFYLLAAHDSLQAYALQLLTQVLSWKKEEVEVLVAKAKDELKNPRIHMYGVYHFVYGQKPKPKDT